ncbi:hypothetical protein BH20GEM1_BH20GEM1_17230 [soil metagenome]
MMKDSPDQSVLDSGLVCRCTEDERVMVGELAALAEMSVSAFVRMGIVRYCAAVQQAASDRTAVDRLVRESAEASQG